MAGRVEVDAAIIGQEAHAEVGHAVSGRPAQPRWHVLGPRLRRDLYLHQDKGIHRNNCSKAMNCSFQLMKKLCVDAQIQAQINKMHVQEINKKHVFR